MNNQIKPSSRANLRKRIRIFGLLTILGVAVLAFTLTFTFMSDRAARLEAAQTQTAMRQALNALEEKLYHLEAAAFDLATWNETYDFVGSLDPAYPDTYLTDEYYFKSDVNLVTLIDSSQTVVYSRALDLNNNQEISLDIQEHLGSGSPLTAGLETGREVSGILFINDFPMLVTAYPVLQSNREGPVRGSLIMGRFIDEAAIFQLEGDLQFSLKIGPVLELKLPEGFWPPAQEDPVVVKPLNEATVVGYSLLEDIYGDQSLVLRGFLPRTIYGESIRNDVLLSLIIILLVCASLIFFLWIVDRKVLKRWETVDACIQDQGAPAFDKPATPDTDRRR
jgi:sensor domain CHASE-containing protein